MQDVLKKYAIAGALAVGALGAVAVVVILLMPAPSSGDLARFNRLQTAHAPSKTHQEGRGTNKSDGVDQ